MTTKTLTDATARALAYINAALLALGHVELGKLPKGTAGDLTGHPIALALAPTGAELGFDRVTFASKGDATKVRKAWGELTGNPDKLAVEGDAKAVRLPRPLWKLRRAVDRGRAETLVRKPAGRKAKGAQTADAPAAEGADAGLAE